MSVLPIEDSPTALRRESLTTVVPFTDLCDRIESDVTRRPMMLEALFELVLLLLEVLLEVASQLPTGERFPKAQASPKRVRLKPAARN